jgi:hypothetical protein
MEIRLVGAKFFRVDGQSDRHYKANSRISQFLEIRLKTRAGLEGSEMRKISSLLPLGLNHRALSGDQLVT